jgi:hypothetical protein
MKQTTGGRHPPPRSPPASSSSNSPTSNSPTSPSRSAFRGPSHHPTSAFFHTGNSSFSTAHTAVDNNVIAALFLMRTIAFLPPLVCWSRSMVLYRLADEGKEKDGLEHVFLRLPSFLPLLLLSRSLTPNIPGVPFRVYVGSSRMRTIPMAMKMSRWMRRICYTTHGHMRSTKQEVRPSQRVVRRYLQANATAIHSPGAVSLRFRCSWG